jgi:hypothetical protein
LNTRSLEDIVSPYALLGNGISSDKIEYVCYHGKPPGKPNMVFVHLWRNDSFMDICHEIDIRLMMEGGFSHKDIVSYFVRSSLNEFRIKFNKDLNEKNQKDQ